MLKGKNQIETFTNSSQLMYKEVGVAGFFVTILSFKTLSHEAFIYAGNFLSGSLFTLLLVSEFAFKEQGVKNINKNNF
jgi:hypothetical protein